MTTRTERDSMGEMEIPAAALYGASTQRAVLNFPISGTRLPLPFIHAYGLIKQAAAETNAELGLLDPALTGKIAAAAAEIADGKHDAQFPVDTLIELPLGEMAPDSSRIPSSPEKRSPGWLR